MSKHYKRLFAELARTNYLIYKYNLSGIKKVDFKEKEQVEINLRFGLPN